MEGVELAELEEAAMRGCSLDSFDVLEYCGGGGIGAVFLARCTEATGNPLWRCDVHCFRRGCVLICRYIPHCVFPLGFAILLRRCAGRGVLLCQVEAVHAQDDVRWSRVSPPLPG
jgi:hypothetical protein